MKGQIHFNPTRGKFELLLDGKVIVSSKHEGYLRGIVREQKHPAILSNRITEIGQPDPSIVVIDADGTEIKAPSYDINQRFDFMKQMIGMVVNKTANSIFLTGEGGIGKTWTVLECLKAAGKTNIHDQMNTIDVLDIEPTDTMEEMFAKAVAQTAKPGGDFVLIKGYSTAKALYRILFENRQRTILFDDCDVVFNDKIALGLLKNALDSYDERRVHWLSEGHDESLPPNFVFHGSIIFISNVPLHKVDEAIKTRVLKVDLAMTKAQRIERMRSVLEHVRPAMASIQEKTDALDLLEKHMHLTNDVNFRMLMTLINIRTDPTVTNWHDLALFAITEH